VGVSAAVVASGTLGAAVVTSVAIVAGGAAAGAIGYGLNEGVEHGFTAKCAHEALRGAGIGALSALPFAALPLLPFVAPAGVAAFGAGAGGTYTAGALSGAIGYGADVASGGGPWDWWKFGKAVVIAAGTAGLGRYLGGKYMN